MDGAENKSQSMDAILLWCQSYKIDFVAVLRERNRRKMMGYEGHGDKKSTTCPPRTIPLPRMVNAVKGHTEWDAPCRDVRKSMILANCVGILSWPLAGKESLRDRSGGTKVAGDGGKVIYNSGCLSSLSYKLRGLFIEGMGEGA